VDPDQTEWYKFDDDKVSLVSRDKILALEGISSPSCGRRTKKIVRTTIRAGALVRNDSSELVQAAEPSGDTELAAGELPDEETKREEELATLLSLVHPDRASSPHRAARPPRARYRQRVRR
jgi:hypothetical protein